MKRQVIKTPNDFRDWMRGCKDTWAFDCETTSLNYLDLEMVGFSICDGNQACYISVIPRHKKELLMILDYYIGEAHMVVFHNFSFDGMVLYREGVEI